MARPQTPDLNAVAELTLGIEALSAAQEEAIEAVVSGKDTLAILPTGAGKSAIYQIAGHLLDGATVVISPLIALQRDQVEKLAEAEAGEAALINSQVSPGIRAEALDAAVRGDVEFLFLAPEQLVNDEAIERIVQARPSLLVVDEAHCISAWGHDFRPDYLALGELVERLEHPTVLALTATASTPVQEEIIERLGMRKAKIVTQSLDRPNIELEVRRFDDDALKRQELIEAVAGEGGPGIVYTATRGNAESLARELQESGIDAVCYHAGLSLKARNEAQARFMAGDASVVVATKAFGMGVDKADIRFVFHAEVSDSIDSYAQEIGRAGRDNRPAKAVLFYHPGDLGIQRFFAGSRFAEVDVSAVLRAFTSKNAAMSRSQISSLTGMSERRTARILNSLIDAGMLRRNGKGSYRPVSLLRPEEGLETVAGLQEQWKQVNASRIDMMRMYAEEDGCRRRLLLNYFGEDLDGPCGNCDNCLRGQAPETPAAAAVEVTHSVWGLGQVLRQEAGRAVIFFQSVGYKTLDLTVALERGLLQMGPATRKGNRAESLAAE